MLAATFVQIGVASNQPTSPITAFFPKPTTAGNFIVAFLGGSAATFPQVFFGDFGGNAYNQISISNQTADFGKDQAVMALAGNIAGGFTGDQAIWIGSNF